MNMAMVNHPKSPNTYLSTLNLNTMLHNVIPLSKKMIIHTHMCMCVCVCKHIRIIRIESVFVSCIMRIWISKYPIFLDTDTILDFLRIQIWISTLMWPNYVYLLTH